MSPLWRTMLIMLSPRASCSTGASMKIVLPPKRLTPLRFWANYDQLGLHISDFHYWVKYWKEFSAKPSEYSVAAQKRMQELRSRMNTVLPNTIKDFEDALRKPQYKDDPRMHEVAETMTNAYNMAKAQKAQAEER